MLTFLPYLFNVLAQEDQTLPIGGAIFGLLAGLVGFVLGILLLVSMWKIFTKAGKPGWAVLIPIYNLYVLLEIVGRPGWWLLLLLIPIVNVIIMIIIDLDLARSFGKGTGFGLGLFFLNFIFILILGFGSAKYIGPSATR
jgi:hypothetical protein